jgi:hypothetical protein
MANRFLTKMSDMNHDVDDMDGSISFMLLHNSIVGLFINELFSSLA